MTESEQIAFIRTKLGDREWRIDNLYYIIDRHGRKVRFVRNESQRRFWNDMWFLNLILKDRQRGFSTLIAIFILDTCLFNSNTAAGIIDITLPDAQKKLRKCQFAYENLPDSLKEARPLDVDAKTSMGFANGSTIDISTSHRGGTLQILHISEMGKIAARFPERAREIRTGALNTIAPGCFIFNESTAEGRTGVFFEDCKDAETMQRHGEKLSELDYKFHFFSWFMGDKNEIDPEGITIPPAKTKYFDNLEETLGVKVNARKRAWYVKKEKQQKSDMLREYPSTPEEAFNASVEGAYFSKQISLLRKNGQIGIVPHDPSAPVNTGWDFGLNDRMCIWFHQRIALQHRLIGFISGTDEDVLFYWREMQKLPYTWGRHFLPHDAGTRRIGTARKAEEKPKTIEIILNAAGMRNTQVVPRVEHKATGIQEVKLFLPKFFIDEKNCDAQPEWNEEENYHGGLSSLQNYRREWDEGKDDWKDTPLHNWASNGYDGLETLVRGFNMFGDIIEEPKPFVPLTAPYEPLDAVIGY